MNKHQTLPRPLLVASHYFGKKGEEYAQGFQSHHIGYRLQAEFFQPHISPQDIVLDFGCGNGGIMKNIKCKEIAGFEINSYVVANARELGITANIYSNIDDLPKNYFGVIYSNHVLEHTLCPLETLKEIRRCLKKDGLLILVLPVDDWRVGYQRTYDPNDPDHHLYTWTTRLISNLLYEAAYMVKDVKIITSAWSPRLFPFYNLPILGKLARWATAILLHRRQLKVLAVKNKRI